MKARLRAFLVRIAKLADRPWYIGLVASLAAADSFIVIVPIEPLLIPAVLLRPHRWFPLPLIAALGSSIGATILSELVRVQGYPLIEKLMPKALHSASWEHLSLFMNDHGSLALFLMSIGPLPQHPAVALAGLMQLNFVTVFLAVFVARAIKYSVVSFLALRFPNVIKKRFGLKPKNA